MSSVIDGVGVEGVHKILDSHESIPLHSSQPAIIDSRVEEGENVMENVTVGRDETPTAPTRRSSRIEDQHNDAKDMRNKAETRKSQQEGEGMIK